MSITRIYPDNSLFTTANATIDGYNGVTIDTTNSASILIGATNASDVTIGRVGHDTNINGNLTVGGGFSMLQGNVSLGTSLGNVLYFYGTAVTSLAFGQGGAPYVYQEDAANDSNSNIFTIAAGNGGDAYATAGGTGGTMQVLAGRGGNGTASHPAGAGGVANLIAGNAGADNGGGGQGGGAVNILAGNGTGTGTYGGSVIIDDGTGSAGSGGIYIGTTNCQGMLIGNTTTYIRVFAQTFAFAAGVDHSIFVEQNNPDTNGHILYLSGGLGGVASATLGGTGGALNAHGGPGGDGTASKQAGAGGSAIFTGGNAGADNGGGGNNGGDVNIDGGIKSTTGHDGYINIGTNYSAQVNIAKNGVRTNVDGYLGIDGYATLSHDVGNTNILALTQATNTTTGADLRLRHLKFFSDNVPTNQAPQNIYATGGDLVLSSAGQSILIDAPTMYWAQNASIYTGGLNLQVGPANDYIAMNYSITNTTVGYDFVSTINGASVGDNISLRHTYDVTQSDNNINNIAHKIVLADHTNDGYTGGSDVGLLVDVSGGANTSNTRKAAKFVGGTTEVDGYLTQKTHSNYTGSEVHRLTAAIQTTTNSTTTIYTLALDGYTTYSIRAIVVARDEAGVEHATLGRVACFYRESGSATQQGTTSAWFTDIRSNAGMDLTMTTSTNNVLIQVTGLTSTTIDWVLTLEYQAVSTTA